ncbi:MAG: hypothetical protein WBE80_13765 [Methylocella sp.]
MDYNGGNNDTDNLAYLCQTDRWMYDAGLDPIKAIRLLRAHWQETKGVPSPQGADEGRGRESSTCPQAERQSAEGLGHPAQQPAATIQLTHYRAFWTLDHAPIMADGLGKSKAFVTWCHKIRGYFEPRHQGRG